MSIAGWVRTERIRCQRRSWDQPRHGTSLVEVSVSILLVGLLLVASLTTVRAATHGQFFNGEKVRAVLLARDLMAEILKQSYREPDQPPDFGPEPSETAGGTRNNFDDVDDYHGWNEAPPARRDGTPLANLAAWQRSVIVQYVDPDDFTLVVASDQGVKRITVTVNRAGTTMASIVMIATQSRLPGS
jgi:hypothetical protein